MSDLSPETVKLLQGARDALMAARTHLQENRPVEARAALETSRDTLEAASADEPQVHEMRAATYAELALLLQNLRDVRGALANYAKAEEVLRALPLDDPAGKDPRAMGYRLQLATTMINKSGLYAAEQAVEDGLVCSDTALELLQGIDEGRAAEAAQMLQIGLLQNRFALLQGARRPEDAEKAIADAFGVVSGQMARGNTQMFGQAIDIALKLAQARRGLQRLDDAFEPVQMAEGWATAAYEVDARLGVGPLVNVKMLLLEMNFQAGRYAEAEDELFEAVEKSREDGRVLVIGTGFYFALLRVADEQLEKGGLPRSEVLESLDELLAKIESKNAPESLRETLNARRAVLVEGDVGSAEALLRDLKQQDYAGDQATSQIAPQLEDDIRWYRENRMV